MIGWLEEWKQSSRRDERKSVLRVCCGVFDREGV